MRVLPRSHSTGKGWRAVSTIRLLAFRESPCQGRDRSCACLPHEWVTVSTPAGGLSVGRKTGLRKNIAVFFLPRTLRTRIRWLFGPEPDPWPCPTLSLRSQRECCYDGPEGGYLVRPFSTFSAPRRRQSCLRSVFRSKPGASIGLGHRSLKRQNRRRFTAMGHVTCGPRRPTPKLPA